MSHSIRRRIQNRVILFGIFTLMCACQRPKPPYSPQDALRTFRLPQGFRIELVAAEPQVADPVAMAFDPRGRIYVVEMPDYPMGEGAGRIKLLTDADADGYYEKASLFAEGLHFPTGVLPWKNGILVTAAPDLLHLQDTDGDDRADKRETILTGFAATNPQLRVNGLVYGIDDWIYVAYPKVGLPARFMKEFGNLGSPIRFPDHAEVAPVDALSKGADLRFKPDELRLEAVAGNSQFGNTFDRWGNRFTVWNNNHVRHVVIQNTYLERNPHLAVETAMESASDHGNAATLYPGTIEPLHLHESEIGHFTSACGISIYEADSFPGDYQGAFFVCDPVHNIVHCDKLTPRGVTFTASRKHENAEFLTSTDSWFRPVFTSIGPDGSLYLVDFYRKIVEHPEWLPPDLLSQPHDLAGSQQGRIYRIAYGADRIGTRPILEAAASAQLVEHLSMGNMWWRMTAQRLLVERKDRSAVAPLVALAEGGAQAETRLHALWTLEGLGSLSADHVLRALDDSNPEIRLNAIKLSERFLFDPKIKEKLLGLQSDPEVRVQFQLACTLGFLEENLSFQALKEMALHHLEDGWFQLAVLTSAARNPIEWLRYAGSDPRFQQKPKKHWEPFLRRIASIIGARGGGSELADAAAWAIQSGSSLSSSLQAVVFDGMAGGLRRSRKNRVRLPIPVQSQLLRSWDSEDERLRKSVLRLLARLELSDSREMRAAIRRAAEMSAREDTEAQRRADAIFLLGLDPAASKLQVLQTYLMADKPETVQSAAARALLASGSPSALPIVFERWRSCRARVKEEIVQELFQDRNRLTMLLEAIERGKVSMESLSRSRRSQLLRFSAENIRDRARRLFGDQALESKRPVLARYQASLRASGDARRGEALFKEQCGKCHRFEGTGYEMGPDLASLVNRTRQDLLAQILDPNANIAPGYEDYLIETKDGRWITGIIARETANSVTLRRAEGEEETLLRAEIASMASSNVSAMPEDLEKAIDIQQMADLLEYLKSARNASKSH